MRASGEVRVKAYDALFEHAFTRVDAERAHHAAFRAIRTARPALATRGGRPSGTGETHPAAPFLPLTRDGTAHGATAAGGTLPPPEAPR